MALDQNLSDLFLWDCIENNHITYVINRKGISIQHRHCIFSEDSKTIWLLDRKTTKFDVSML